MQQSKSMGECTQVIQQSGETLLCVPAVGDVQKNILGLVQGPPCRIDVDFKDEKGRRYQKTAVVKGKNGETEELPLYTNHDNIYGEVRINCFQHQCQHQYQGSMLKQE